MRVGTVAGIYRRRRSLYGGGCVRRAKLPLPDHRVLLSQIPDPFQIRHSQPHQLNQLLSKQDSCSRRTRVRKALSRVTLGVSLKSKRITASACSISFLREPESGFLLHPGSLNPVFKKPETANTGTDHGPHTAPTAKTHPPLPFLAGWGEINDQCAEFEKSLQNALDGGRSKRIDDGKWDRTGLSSGAVVAAIPPVRDFPHTSPKGARLLLQADLVVNRLGSKQTSYFLLQVHLLLATYCCRRSWC